MAGLLEQDANVTPEEQQAYNEFVGNAYKILYSEKTFPEFIARLRKAAEQDPVEGLSSVTVMAIIRVQESARRNGKMIDPVVVFHAGSEILAAIADTAAKAGIHEYDEKEIEAASLRAMDKYVAVANEAGLIDKQRAIFDYQSMLQADKEGKLDEMFPGVEEKYATIGDKALSTAGAEGEQPMEGDEDGAEHEADPNEEDELRQMPRGRR